MVKKVKIHLSNTDIKKRKIRVTPTQKFYELHEFDNNITTLFEIIIKIKNELQVNTFDEISQQRGRVLAHISDQKVPISKLLTLSELLENSKTINMS